MNFTHKGYAQQAIEAKRIEQLLSCLETLSLQNIHRLKSFWDRSIVMETPLLSVQGKEEVLRQYSAKFEALDIQKIRVSGYAISHSLENILFIKWDQKCVLPNRANHAMSGMTELTWDLAGDKIMHWQEFWNPDPVFAAQSKLFRFVLSQARKKL